MKNTRVLHLADLHICLSGPRREECVRILEWIACNVQTVKPNIIVIAGDIFDRRSTPAERLYLVDFLRAISAVARSWRSAGTMTTPTIFVSFGPSMDGKCPLTLRLSQLSSREVV